MLLFVCSLLLATPASANFDNYNSILIGDQAAGMGGAATAMDEDASALAWYNPGALAKLKGQSFSAAVGIYKKFDIRYKDDGDLGRASLRVNQGFFRALPSSTGSVIRPKEILPDWTMALSILVPEYQTFKGDISSEGQSSSTLNMTTESIWVGGAMSKELNEKDSVGFTIYYTARSVSKTVNDRTITSPTQSKIFTEERNMTQNGLVAVLGWHRNISDRWKVGVSYRPPNLHVAGQGEVSQTLIEDGSIGTPINEREIPTRARIPWKAAIGFAYLDPGFSKWAFDISTHGPMSYGDVEKFELAEKIEHKQVWNVHLGYEKQWRDWLKSRLGIFTNFSSHPNPDPALVNGQGDHVDQGGFSANLAFLSGNIEYTFGGYYTGGRGRSVQRINQVYEVVPKVENIFTMLVGTSYSF